MVDEQGKKSRKFEQMRRSSPQFDAGLACKDADLHFRIPLFGLTGKFWISS